MSHRVSSKPDQLEALRVLARVLDDLIRIPGTNMRVGLDALIGLVPGAGDAVTAVVATYALLVAQRVGAPPSVLARMAVNVVVDLVVGAVPLVGDVFDVGWKANRRNVELLARYLEAPRAVRASSRLVVAALIAGLLAVLVGLVMLSAWLVRGLASAL